MSQSLPQKSFFYCLTKGKKKPKQPIPWLPQALCCESIIASWPSLGLISLTWQSVIASKKSNGVGFSNTISWVWTNVFHHSSVWQWDAWWLMDGPSHGDLGNDPGNYLPIYHRHLCQRWHSTGAHRMGGMHVPCAFMSGSGPTLLQILAPLSPKLLLLYDPPGGLKCVVTYLNKAFSIIEVIGGKSTISSPTSTAHQQRGPEEELWEPKFLVWRVWRSSSSGSNNTGKVFLR